MEVTVDRRVQRTRQLLRDALYQLIIERGYEGITIQDITERANLGRTTFYLHYQDKEELLKASIQALMHELQLEVEPSPDESCGYLLRCVRIFNHVAQNRPLYQAMLKETGPVNIGNLMQSYFVELFQRHLLAQQGSSCAPTVNNELVAVHAAGALLGLLGWWLNNSNALSAGEMGQIYFRLMSKGAGDISLSSQN